MLGKRGGSGFSLKDSNADVPTDCLHDGFLTKLQNHTKLFIREECLEEIMSVQSKMPCWEIIQCNKKESCLFAENNKKSCWEMVGKDDAISFHVCIDCLVYLAKHKDSTLTEKAFFSILEKRKRIITHIPVYGDAPSRTLLNSAIPTRDHSTQNLFLSV